MHRSATAIAGMVRKQAYIMAFSDAFYLLGAALVVVLFATLLLRNPGHVKAGGGH